MASEAARRACAGHGESSDAVRMEAAEMQQGQPESAAQRRLPLEVYRYAMAWFLGSLLLQFCAMPLTRALPGGQVVATVMFTCTCVLGILAIGGRHHLMAIAVLLTSPTIIARWVAHYHSHPVLELLSASTGILFTAFMILQLLRFIIRSPRVNSEVICAGISAYLMMALGWAFAYALVAAANPGAFNIASANGAPAGSMHDLNSVYFSLITLSTVGYGDITPVSDIAKVLCSLEAMIGSFYMAIFVARLVSLYNVSGPAIPIESPEQPDT